MSADAVATTWAWLADVEGPVDRFDPETTRALPDSARRFLRRALPAGAPLVRAIELRMEGRIRLGPRWFPFRAAQILRAGAGFVWRPTVGGRIVRFVGADLLGPDGARMEFRFHGVIPVVKATGPDVARSAAGRLAAETVVWQPQALTPQAGARWRPVDDAAGGAEDRSVVTLDAAGSSIDVEVTVDEEGRLRSLALERWNGSSNPPGPEPFGGRIDAEHVTPGGIHIAGAGAVGWGWGTAAWPQGEFFRFTIADVGAVPPTGLR